MSTEKEEEEEEEEEEFNHGLTENSRIGGLAICHISCWMLHAPFFLSFFLLLKGMLTISNEKFASRLRFCRPRRMKIKDPGIKAVYSIKVFFFLSCFTQRYIFF